MLNIPYEVQQALRKGDMRKNYKMKVNDVDPDTGERTYLYTIDNDTLVSESVKIDERMVTGKVLKFGLCEGSSLEFQYFDHPNINGKDVQVYCSVEYVDGNGDVAWYDIPMGWYTVDQCPKQFSTGIYKATAYNKLRSDYLDTKANLEVLNGFTDNINELTIYDIRRNLLAGYEVFESHEGMQPVITGQAIPATNIEVTGLNFSALYGIDTPFSAYDYNEYKGSMPTLNTNIGFSISANIYPYKSALYSNGLYNGVYEIDFLQGDIVKFEKNFYTYIVNILDKAQLKKNGVLLSGYDAVDLLCAAGNMAHILGARVLYSHIQTGQTRVYNYSTIQWDYEERKNITHTVQGTLKDFFDVALNVEKDAGEDCYLSIYLPSALWKSWGGYPISFEIGGGYSYYTDDTYTDYITSASPALYYPNGNIYDDSALNNLLVYPLSDYVSKADLVRINPLDVSDFTLRDLVSAVYEVECQYGKLDRETDLFTGVELNQGGLYPADTLYPANSLYPSGNMEHPFPSTYSKLWTDTVGEQSFRYLIITYKAMENGQEVEKTLQRTVNADGTTNYNMSDNWLFRNLVWSDADVGAYADAMVLKMKDIRWFPFEMWCAGLPYVETGDAIEITDRQGDTHTSYVLTRTLDGIHNLQDTFINGELDIF